MQLQSITDQEPTESSTQSMPELVARLLEYPENISAAAVLDSLKKMPAAGNGESENTSKIPDLLKSLLDATIDTPDIRDTLFHRLFGDGLYGSGNLVEHLSITDMVTIVGHSISAGHDDLPAYLAKLFGDMVILASDQAKSDLWQAINLSPPREIILFNTLGEIIANTAHQHPLVEFAARNARLALQNEYLIQIGATPNDIPSEIDAMRDTNSQAYESLKLQEPVVSPHLAHFIDTATHREAIRIASDAVGEFNRIMRLVCYSPCEFTIQQDQLYADVGDQSARSIPNGDLRLLHEPITRHFIEESIGLPLSRVRLETQVRLMDRLLTLRPEDYSTMCLRLQPASSIEEWQALAEDGLGETETD